MYSSELLKRMGQKADGFSFLDGIYTEQDELLWEDGILMQKCSRKTKMVLQMYSRLDDKYFVLYQKTLENPLTLSEKLDIKYLYHISVQSFNHRSISDYNGTSQAAHIRRQHMEKDVSLRKQLAEKEARFDRRADNFERFQHNSFHANEYRYMSGQMSREDYYEEKISRDVRKFLATEKEQDAVADNLRAMHYYWAQAAGQEQATRKRITERNERIRLMPVGEVAYRNGELIALIVYKEPQVIKEIQCADSMDLDCLEGEILLERNVMKRYIDYKPLLDHVEKTYGIVG